MSIMLTALYMCVCVCIKKIINIIRYNNSSTKRHRVTVLIEEFSHDSGKKYYYNLKKKLYANKLLKSEFLYNLWKVFEIVSCN